MTDRLWTQARGKILCIDLQIDPALGLAPDAQAVFGARQLLANGRRLGWPVAHARRRSAPKNDARDVIRIAGGLRPLPTEPVFLRDGQTIAAVGGLAGFLEGWRGQTVHVAAFDRTAALSCLRACQGFGPRFVLVEDAMADWADSGSAGFRADAERLGARTTTLARVFPRGPAHGGLHHAGA